MKIFGIILILAVVIVGYYFLSNHKEDLLNDPEVQKFARINAELSIEYQHLEEDSSFFVPARDSIYDYYHVDENWMGEITDRINKQPELWDDVYELMISHAEAIRDSLLHKKPLSDDSI